MKAQACIANYINGNLSDAKRQAQRISIRDLFDAAILAGKSHHVSILIAHYLKNPTREGWEYLCRHEANRTQGEILTFGENPQTRNANTTNE